MEGTLSSGGVTPAGSPKEGRGGPAAPGRMSEPRDNMPSKDAAPGPGTDPSLVLPLGAALPAAGGPARCPRPLSIRSLFQALHLRWEREEEKTLFKN